MPTGERNRRWGRATLLAALFAALPAPAAPAAGRAQAATDLFLVHLREAGERVAVDSVVRLTDRNGYDNQPHILPDGRTLLYTSIAGGQADIMRLDLVTNERSNLTRSTPESEYSATLMPGGDRFSVIRVEADSTQRLWSFRLDGSDPRLVLAGLQPVGYQAWIDADRIAVFILGSPPALRIADVRDGSTRVVATDIGRSLNRVPGRAAVSFVHREAGAPGRIRVYDTGTGAVTDLAAAMAGNEYHVWTREGRLLSAEGSVFYQWTPGSGGEWTPVADLAAAGVRGISRLALSADGRLLVVVSER